MTRDPDHRTPQDDAIDDVARGMTLSPTPDLRARIAARLDTPARAVRWWQPALTAAAVMLAALTWWMRPAAPQVELERPPVVARIPQAPQPRGSEQPVTPPAPTTASHTAPRVARAVAPAPSGVARNAEPLAFPPLSVEPLSVEPVETVALSDLALPHIPELAVESLRVEPLPRSNP
jgi:hypothetical protein